MKTGGWRPFDSDFIKQRLPLNRIRITDLKYFLRTGFPSGLPLNRIFARKLPTQTYFRHWLLSDTFPLDLVYSQTQVSFGVLSYTRWIFLEWNTKIGIQLDRESRPISVRDCFFHSANQRPVFRDYFHFQKDVNNYRKWCWECRWRAIFVLKFNLNEKLFIIMISFIPLA